MITLLSAVKDAPFDPCHTMEVFAPHDKVAKKFERHHTAFQSGFEPGAVKKCRLTRCH